MSMNRRQLLVDLGAAFALSGTLPGALAQPSSTADWPSKPLRLITGGVGSVTDVRARWVAERLGRALGQTIVVENKGGAGGGIGLQEMARSAPDGYTLGMVHQGTLAINPHLYANTGYDALRDFAPITRMGAGPLLLTVHPGVAAKTVQELVTLHKSRPGGLSYGSPGIGTPPHMASELFLRATGITATHVPYKGGGPLMADLIGGQVAWSMEGPAVQTPHVKAGRLRALAVSGPQRMASLPEVPTMAQAGVPFEFVGWTGLASKSRYYVRVNQLLQNNSWDASETYYIDTIDCTPR
jgi:tripartite-type tricarboxylate transporter receptor subunit TctC